MTGVGLTCAGCHTGSFTYKDTAVVIDGGPALTNLFTMKQGMGISLLLTRYWPGRFDATGFVFNEYTEWALLDAIRRAIWVYRDNKDAWRALQVNGMAKDLSWDRSAREYVKIYESAISRGRP